MDAKDGSLKSKIHSLHEAHPWYGHRRLAWSMGICFEKARRLMKKFAIEAKVRLRRKFTKTADIGLPDTKIPNLTKDICPMRANVICRTDFTHIIYHGVHLYLATVIDAYTREIIGYSISFVHTKEFALEAIKMALTPTQFIPQIFHSDQ
jgi:transposase InsO family protein